MSAVFVKGIGLWTPGAPDLEAWLAGGSEGSDDAPSCEILPSRLRRATSLIIKIGAEVISQAATQDGVDLSTVKLVFGSAYGEFQTAVDQMEMMEGADGRLSPARFKNSVHNTVTGLLSIALRNRGFGTAVAAGSATFAMSLLEALALLDSEGGEVVVAVADDLPAAPFYRGRPFAPLGVAFCLAAEPGASGGARIGGLGRAEVDDGWLEAIPAELLGNPAAAALPLVRALQERQPARVPVELGVSEPLSVEVSPPDTQRS